MILLCVFLPIVFMGVKYVLDLSKKNTLIMEKSSGKYYKKCAREAALAVAKNWNPGLTLSQQKDAVIKIADAVYNANPCFNDSIIGNSIPGLNIKKDHKIESNSKFGSIIVSSNTVTSPSKLINYKTAKKYNNSLYSHNQSENYSLWNPYCAMWRSIDKGTEASYRNSLFDDLDEDELKKNNYALKHHDIYVTPFVYYGYMGTSYPTNDNYSDYDASSSRFYLISPHTSNTNNFSYSPYTRLSYATVLNSSSETMYKVRENANDTTVQVSIDNDKIKVLTDKDIGYAIPAECNVDIVLAIPTNGAANNISNYDAASSTAGSPYYVAATTDIPANVKTTPIYQMGQACKRFVKNHFYHVKGVNVGLIPYSGKVSISPDKTSYTSVIAQLSSYYFISNPLNYKTIRGVFLYSTKGEKNAPLSNTYSWNTVLTGCPIMCRRGTTQSYPQYGNNSICIGDLLSNSSPSSSTTYFQRMNLNPCYMGYANLLGIKCEKTCTTFLPNPYYMIEPTADLVKIYEMCNAMYPIYDPNNVSNFVFIPITWANNFFQSWTNNPVASANANQLSRETKMTPGRKKALILLINKPDWFEPGELTYLGFNNDLSEIPMMESDKINFAINYGDTGKYFLNGDKYDGTIAGAKKILKYTIINGTVSRNTDSGYYECKDSGIGRFTFPTKGMVKITVAPKTNSRLEWIQREPNLVGSFKELGSIHCINGLFLTTHYYEKTILTSADGINWIHSADTSRSLSCFKLCYVNKKIYAAASNLLISTDGYNWTQIFSTPAGANIFQDIAYGNGLFILIGCKSLSERMLYTSTDGATWTQRHYGGNESLYSIAYGNGLFVILGNGMILYTTTDGITLTLRKHPSNKSFSDVVFMNGMFILCGSGGVFTSIDGINWTQKSSEALVEIILVNDKFFGVNSSGYIYESSDLITWERHKNKPGISYNCHIAYNESVKMFVVTDGNGKMFSADYPIKNAANTFQFTNVSGNTATYNIEKEETFYIDSSKIPSTKDSNGNYYVDFNMNGIKLVSAEISNYQMLTDDAIDFSSSTTGKNSKIRYYTSSGSVSKSYTSGYYETTTRNAECTGYITNNYKGKLEVTVEPTDPGGLEWVERDPKLTGTWKNLSGAYFFNGLYFTSDVDVGEILTSADGITWTHTNKFDYLSRFSLCYVNGKYFAATGDIHSSSDGKSWTKVASTPPGANIFISLAYGKNTFVAVGCDSLTKRLIYTSTNGTMWTKRQYGVGFYDLYEIAFGNNIFVAVGGRGGKTLLTSTDGITWTERESQIPETSVIRRVYFMDGAFLAFCNSKIYKSIDGINWNSKSSGIYFSGLTKAGGNYFGVDSSGNIYESQNLSNWTKHTSKPSSSLYSADIVYAPSLGRFLIIDHYGKVYTADYPPPPPEGTFQFTSGSDTSSRKINTRETISVITTEASTYFTLKNIRLISAKFTPQNQYAHPSDMVYSRRFNWSNNPVSYDSNLNIANYYTNYNSSYGYHTLKTSYCAPYMSPSVYHGDGTFITEEYSALPYYGYFKGGNESQYYYFPGFVRKFEQIKRSSSLKYFYLFPYSSSYNDMAKLIATDFTYPINTVLYNGGYQSDVSISSNEAVSKVTAAACAKLKKDYGKDNNREDNVRIYVVKYRKQSQYKSFPFYNVTQSNVNHDYSTVDACATSGYVYDVTTEADLNTKLSAIAADIKSFAKYQEAKNVE